VLYLVDARDGVTPEEEPILARLPSGVPRLTVHNKADLMEAACSRMERADGVHVWVSAKSGEGMDVLQGELLRIAGLVEGQEGSFLARERHVKALAAAADHLSQAGLLLNQSDLFAEELRLAHRQLGTITGEVSADDLLGEIFSRFCIGK
jgi:tRNA modification GTPase